MRSNINIEAQLREFQEQTYPTVEQTIVNNASVLYKRKKFFLEDLRQSLKFLGFLLLGIVYLRDLSMFRFAIRAFSQYSISNPYPTPSARIVITDESKRALTKFLLLGVLMANGFCLLTRLIFGVYLTSPSPDGYLHGGMSVQFIGERVPYSTLELLLFDGIIFFIQLVFHNLMCITDDSKVLESKKPELGTQNDECSIDKSQIEGDGYNGDVYLITIDLISGIKRVLKFDDSFQYNFSSTTSSHEETSFGLPAASSFV